MPKCVSTQTLKQTKIVGKWPDSTGGWMDSIALPVSIDTIDFSAGVIVIVFRPDLVLGSEFRLV